MILRHLQRTRHKFSAINTMEERACHLQHILTSNKLAHKHSVNILKACQEVDHSLILAKSILTTLPKAHPITVEDQRRAKVLTPTRVLIGHSHSHSNIIPVKVLAALPIKEKVLNRGIMLHPLDTGQGLVSKSKTARAQRVSTHHQKWITYKMLFKMLKNWSTTSVNNGPRPKTSIDSDLTTISEARICDLIT